MFFYLKKESIYFFRIFGPLIFLLPFLNAQGFDPVTGERLDSNYKYFTIHAGMGFGTLEKFYAESAFSDPDNPSRPLWTANVLDVKTANKFPQIALKFGGWKSWFGGEMEMSYLGHKIPEQIVYYDSYGKILIDHNIHSLTDTTFYFTIEPQDSVDLPESFLSFNSFSFGGSGYDIACSLAKGPIIYETKNNIYNEINFDPPFKEKLFFVYLNKKQNSKIEVDRFKNIKVDKETIKSINSITEIISKTKNYDEFNFLIKKHEKIISNLINKTCVKNLKFKDFKGEIKSLGAWGGDFILASGINSPSYFESKGYKTIVKFDDMIYRKES